jgi:hypothetical protein
MRVRYLTGIVRAQRQTELAFLCSFDWSDDHGYVAHDQWVPLSVIDPSDHDEIEQACDGDMVEISVAEWWLRDKL